MRIKLDIDQDVLERVEELAARQRTTVGQVLSQLARSALAQRGRSAHTRNGVPVLPKKKGARIVTPEIINRLRDAES